MKRLLKRGDRFTSKMLNDCGYKLDWIDGSGYVIDKSVLKNFHENHIYEVTEHKPGGWERKIRKELDPVAGDFSRVVFRVVSTAMSGGGEGHGPGDVYPDGHGVSCETNDGLFLQFYQSGCFTYMIGPENVELVGNDSARSATRGSTDIS